LAIAQDSDRIDPQENTVTSKRAAPQRAYDVVLYGATGFVGRQTVAHFVAHALGVRWALAGRSAAKLEQVRAAGGPGAAGAGIIVADAADQKALDALAGSTAVVLSTAGPFAAPTTSTSPAKPRGCAS
jgi:short subunit dehydrogenase-like uncharacterized protein